MKVTSYALVLCLLCVGPGCTLVNNATRNILWEVCLCKEETAEKKRNRQMAEAAWTAFREAKPGEYSEHYTHGFKDGFADYMLLGGSGQPPTLPPPHYWNRKYQSPLGYAAIEDWFAGFRMGTAAAMDSGFRRYVMLPFMGPVPPGETPEGAEASRKRAPSKDHASKAPPPVSSDVARDLIRKAQQPKTPQPAEADETPTAAADAPLPQATMSAPEIPVPAATPGPANLQVQIGMPQDSPTNDEGTVTVPEVLIKQPDPGVQPASVGAPLVPKVSRGNTPADDAVPSATTVPAIAVPVAAGAALDVLLGTLPQSSALPSHGTMSTRRTAQLPMRDESYRIRFGVPGALESEPK